MWGRSLSLNEQTGLIKVTAIGTATKTCVWSNDLRGEKKETAHSSLHLIPGSSSAEDLLRGLQNPTSEAGFPMAAGRCRTASLSRSIHSSETKGFSIPILFLLCSLPSHYTSLAQWNLLLAWCGFHITFTGTSDLKPWQARWPWSISISPFRMSCGLSHIFQTK